MIGSGIAGLACARALTQQGRHHVTLYEAGSHFGGHTNTIDVTLDGITHPVDTGFLVFNQRTYPNLIRLFAELGVPVAKSEMSFSVSVAGAVEWAGTNLASVFAQPGNLVNPRFLGMLRDIVRFNRAATAAVRDSAHTPMRGAEPLPEPFSGVSARLAAATASTAAGTISLGTYLERGRYGRAFRDWYLLPMAGAIWSCPAAAMLDYPFATFVRFCHNHGLLQVRNRPQWFTVKNGARQYVSRITAALSDARCHTPVRAVRRAEGSADAGVLVDASDGVERFDAVVLACHSDQALALLEQPSDAERAVLSAIRYQPNVAWLHTDTALLPQRRAAWAAWNYLGGGSAASDTDAVCVTYLMNKLQPLPFTTPLMVTLNPSAPPLSAKVIARIEYAHPVFDAAAIAAQQALENTQGSGRVWFAGAWTGYGFHEDGLVSGEAVAAALGRRSLQGRPHLPIAA